MADKTPLKYESGQHKPFEPGDTIPDSYFDLRGLIHAGEGFEVTEDSQGRVTITNTCCPPPDSEHIISEVNAPESAEEGEQVCWTIVLDGPVEGSDLTLQGVLSGDEQDEHNYPAPSVTIPVGSSTGQMCVQTTDDSDIEPDRELCLAVAANPRVVNSPAPRCVTVLDNDASVHTVTCVEAPTTASGGETVCWAFELDSPVVGTPLQVTSTLTGTEQSENGYTAPSTTVAVGDSSGQLCVQLAPGDRAEDLQLCLAINTSARITAVTEGPCSDPGPGPDPEEPTFNLAPYAPRMGCCSRDSTLESYAIVLRGDGTASGQFSCWPGTTTAWAVGGDPTEYEVMLESVGAMMPPPDFGVSSPTDEWVPMTSAGAEWHWTVSTVDQVPKSVMFRYRLRVRKVGASTDTATSPVSDVEVRLFSECL